jgi:hypothetical protein
MRFLQNVMGGEFLCKFKESAYLTSIEGKVTSSPILRNPVYAKHGKAYHGNASLPQHTLGGL